MKKAKGTAPPIDLADADLDALEVMPVPRYDRAALDRSVVHIGVGAFHRAHLATYVHELCELGHTAWSIVGSGVTPFDGRVADALTAQHGLYTLIERGESETTTKVIGSIVDYVFAAEQHEELIERIAAPETRIVSLTITEGGYPVDDHTGRFDPARTATAFEIITLALARRRADGTGPLTVVSCDNVIGNGNVARTATVGSAELTDATLASWIDTEVAFPNSMVDRITPATTDADRQWLRDEFGVIDRSPVVTEPFRQWVLEDSFVGEIPPFEEVGVLVTADVEPYEILKLRLLNASHSCLAYLAALAGFELVDQVLKADDFRAFIEHFMFEEGIPVLPSVPGVDVPAYAEELMERFANPAIGDQIARLCLDGSSKFPKFLLPTVRAQLARGGSVSFAALALAGWCRYLAGSDDAGQPLERSYDPRLDELSELALTAQSDPRAFIGFVPVFGDDLVEDPIFVSAFADALGRLQTSGVRSAIDVANRRGPHDRNRTGN